MSRQSITGAKLTRTKPLVVMPAPTVDCPRPLLNGNGTRVATSSVELLEKEAIFGQNAHFTIHLNTTPSASPLSDRSRDRDTRDLVADVVVVGLVHGNVKWIVEPPTALGIAKPLNLGAPDLVVHDHLMATASSVSRAAQTLASMLGSPVRAQQHVSLRVERYTHSSLNLCNTSRQVSVAHYGPPLNVSRRCSTAVKTTQCRQKGHRKTTDRTWANADAARFTLPGSEMVVG